MFMIISVLNQKGGVGKTTLAVNLARDYTKRGIKTLLVDSDPQGSALRWHERSNGDLVDMTCICTTTLDKDVMRFMPYYDRIVIDGIPRVSPLTLAAIKCSDLILIPVQPTPYDIWATEEIVRNVQDRIEMTDGKVNGAFVVSRRIVGTNIGKEIDDHLLKMELDVLKSSTSQRVSYATSVEEGLTVLDGKYYGSTACKEIEQLINEIEGKYNGAN